MAAYPGTTMDWWLEQTPETWATALAVQAQIHKR